MGIKIDATPYLRGLSDAFNEVLGYGDEWDAALRNLQKAEQWLTDQDADPETVREEALQAVRLAREALRTMDDGGGDE